MDKAIKSVKKIMDKKMDKLAAMDKKMDKKCPARDMKKGK